MWTTVSRPGEKQASAVALHWSCRATEFPEAPLTSHDDTPRGTPALPVDMSRHSRETRVRTHYAVSVPKRVWYEQPTVWRSDDDGAATFSNGAPLLVQVAAVGKTEMRIRQKRVTITTCLESIGPDA